MIAMRAGAAMAALLGIVSTIVIPAKLRSYVPRFEIEAVIPVAETDFPTLLKAIIIGDNAPNVEVNAFLTLGDVFDKKWIPVLFHKSTGRDEIISDRSGLSNVMAPEPPSWINFLIDDPRNASSGQPPSITNIDGCQPFYFVTTYLPKPSRLNAQISSFKDFGVAFLSICRHFSDSNRGFRISRLSIGGAPSFDQAATGVNIRADQIANLNRRDENKRAGKKGKPESVSRNPIISSHFFAYTVLWRKRWKKLLGPSRFDPTFIA